MRPCRAVIAPAFCKPTLATDTPVRLQPENIGELRVDARRQQLAAADFVLADHALPRRDAEKPEDF